MTKDRSSGSAHAAASQLTLAKLLRIGTLIQRQAHDLVTAILAAENRHGNVQLSGFFASTRPKTTAPSVGPLVRRHGKSFGRHVLIDRRSLSPPSPYELVHRRRLARAHAGDQQLALQSSRCRYRGVS